MAKLTSRTRLALLGGAIATSALVAGAVAIAVHFERSKAAPPEKSTAGEEVAREGDPDASADDDASATSITSGPSPRTFNVVLLTIDTLRWDLGYMGYPRPITPNIDKLAARGTVYERAYAVASYTPKCIGPMLIGRYTSETFRDGEHYTTFHPSNVFVAERAHEAGHRTFAAMCHHYFKWKTGYEQGFDIWDTSSTPASMADNDPSVTSEQLTDVALGLLADANNVTPGTDDVDAGLDAIDGGAPDPRRFFAWFHYMDPHLPYVRHEETPDLVSVAPDAAPPLRNLYDGEVWFTDKHVGRVLDHIASQPWAPDTAIILTADHGESFGEHGFLRHGRELWESVVRVPLIVYVPGTAPRRIEAKRSHIDLVPTIMDLLGIPQPEPGTLRGKSLLADVTAKPGNVIEERDVYMDMPEGPFNEIRRAFITGDSPGLKLIEFPDDRYELYDLAVDPLETKNLRGSKERFEAVRERMKQFRAGLSERPAPPPKPRAE